MIILSNTTMQVLAPGKSIAFDMVVKHTGNGEFHKDGTSYVKMKFVGGNYDIHFSGNIATAVEGQKGEIAITMGKDTLFETKMKTCLSNYISVSKLTNIKNNGNDQDKLRVTNVGNDAIIIDEGTCFFVKRVG